MKNAQRTAERWFRDAEHTLRQAGENCRPGSYNVACFLAEQASQKALKAILYFDGERFVNVHSIAMLIANAGERHPELLVQRDAGAKLDQYYLSARYPDAVAEPAIPAELFVREQAEEAVAIARKIFEVSRLVAH